MILFISLLILRSFAKETHSPEQLRATDPSNDGDMGGILDPQCVAAWSAAMADDTHWHHLAATDDGTTVTVYLDGQKVAQRRHVLAPQTAAGFQVGGWGDGSRCFDGWLAGVNFYHTALTAQQISAAMAATRPKALPPPPPSRSVLYRGPILLTYDPRLNGYSACPKSLDSSGFVSGKIVSISSWLQAHMVIEFVVGGKTIRLCDFSSAGLNGRDYTSWLPLVFSSPTVPTAPFTKNAPARTFILGKAVAASSCATESVAVKLHIVTDGKDSEIRRFSIPHNRWHLLHDEIFAVVKQRPKAILAGGRDLCVCPDELQSLGAGEVLRVHVHL